ncbi:MAG: IgGFc-binding protein [Myxococcota bacterium]|nr:IgGFc-binding protein [Myxococcota bacterium]
MRIYLIVFALGAFACNSDISGDENGGSSMLLTAPMATFEGSGGRAVSPGIQADQPADEEADFLDTETLPQPDMAGAGTPAETPSSENSQPSSPGACNSGDIRCPQDGGEAYEYCRPDQTWTLLGCPRGEVCIANGCTPDPNNCVEGATICLPSGLPARCENQAWAPQPACSDGNACYQGECLSRACATAAQRSSYQGCDYLAVDLPNSAMNGEDPSAATTPDAPVGLVVANTKNEPVLVTVYAPEGTPTPLVAERTIEVPANVMLPFDVRARLRSIQVTSQVRDSAGLVVADRIASADRIEVPPLGTAILLLPRRMGPMSRSAIQKDAYRLRSTVPVVVYQFSPYCCNFSFSNDASLLLPTTAVGTRYRYMGTPFFSIVSPQGMANYPTTLAVLSPHDGNRVRITLPAGAAIQYDTEERVVQGIPCQSNQDCPAGTGRCDLANNSCDGPASRRNVEVTMNAQEVLTILGATREGPGSDLSGSTIESDQPVSVFSSHICTFYPASDAACDHLQEQLLPISTWGASFQLIPPAERNPGHPNEVVYWKFTGADELTRIRLSVPFQQLRPRRPGFNGVPYCESFVADGDTIVLRPGEYCEFGTKSAFAAVADKPTMVLGIIVGQAAAGITTPFGDHGGDPALFLVPPDRQFRRDYVFMTPDTYYSDFVTVITPANNQIELDGMPLNLAGAQTVAGSDAYVYIHVPLANDGAHTITGTLPFGITVYAYDDFVSYAYTGGLNLSKR